MMRLMRTPEQLRMMLPSVEPVNIKVMYHQEEQHLQRQWPGCDNVQGRQVPGSIHRLNDIVEYKDLEKIALYQRIPYQSTQNPSLNTGSPSYKVSFSPAR